MAYVSPLTMVSSLLADALTDPTLVLHDLFRDCKDIDSFPASVSAHFSQVFSSLEAFKEIPVLSVQTPPDVHKDRALVRFRAMVQDTSPSPEMYLAKRTGGRCGGWGMGDDDSATRDQTPRSSINYADLRECTVIWAVTIPGECPWVANELDEPLIPTDKRTAHRPSQPHKFPVPDTVHIGVQVKIYDNSRAAETLRSTELRTFVGILTSEPLHADLELPDPPLVPTLHVLFSQPVPSSLIPHTPKPLAGDIRDELITWIAEQALAGDHEAAEWVLISIIARVQSRSPPILPPSLTLSSFPSPSPPSAPAVTTKIPSISIVLSHILPTLSTIPLSLHTLNTTAFSPESKNEDLHSGWLQLPPGSLCIVTEGGVTEGGVFERGLTNLRALQQMITSQTLEYVFPYSRFAFDTDVGFLVLSEGRKSAFFQTTVNIPLQPVGIDSKEGLYKSADEIVFPPSEKLDLFRGFVGNAKSASVTIGERAAEHIQNDFVAERQATTLTTAINNRAGEAFSSDDLIHRMTVARLLALSLQEAEITIDIWEKAKALEARRLARLA